jgi:hypothetical protein
MTEAIQLAGLVAPDQPMPSVQVITQAAIVIEPPERRTRDQQMICAACHQLPQMSNRGFIVARVSVWHEATVGEVSAFQAAQMQNRRIVFVDYQHSTTARDHSPRNGCHLAQLMLPNRVDAGTSANGYTEARVSELFRQRSEQRA